MEHHVFFKKNSIVIGKVNTKISIISIVDKQLSNHLENSRIDVMTLFLYSLNAVKLANREGFIYIRKHYKKIVYKNYSVIITYSLILSGLTFILYINLNFVHRLTLC
jgi:hypothetical protein